MLKIFSATLTYKQGHTFGLTTKFKKGVEKEKKRERRKVKTNVHVEDPSFDPEISAWSTLKLYYNTDGNSRRFFISLLPNTSSQFNKFTSLCIKKLFLKNKRENTT